MSDPLSLINQPRLVELAQTLVAIPSVTGQEQAIGNWVFDYFNTLGLAGVQRLPVDEAGDTIIGWIDGPADKPAMLLNFHLDTFDVFDGWQTDPFVPHLEDGCLYGLGAHDMKGGAACLLGAVEALVHAGVELGGRLVIAATSDEENWSRGAHALINSGLLDNCRYGMIPEPCAPGTLIVGARGRHVFHLKFSGKTVHAAYLGGINALVDAAAVAANLGMSDAVDLGYLDEFAMTGSLCPIGLQSGGTLILVPEAADLYIDRHILPGQTVEEAAAQIRVVVEQADIAGSYEMSWDERPTPAPAPYVVAADSHLVQTVQNRLAEEFQQPIQLTLARSVADNSHFAVYGNIPTLLCGPQGGNTCEANEYVSVDSLVPVARTYARSVMTLLGAA